MYLTRGFGLEMQIVNFENLGCKLISERKVEMFSEILPNTVLDIFGKACISFHLGL